MDPIEELLSGLTPARTREDLDRAMTRLFDRASGRARRRRIARTGGAMATMLVIGMGIGYRVGHSKIELPVTEITYVAPIQPTATTAASLFDYSKSGETLLSGALRLTVEVKPAPGTGASGERGV